MGARSREDLEPGYYGDAVPGFPLVVAKSVGPLRAEHVPEMAAIFDEAVAQRKPYITIIDARGPMTGDARYRKAVADYANRSAEVGKRYIQAAIIVLDSAVARMVLIAVQWLHETPTRLEVVATVDQAADLAESVWRAKHGEPPLPMRAALSRLRSESIEYVRARPGRAIRSA